MKFRLLHGKHRLAGGMIHKAGDVIESNQDLSAVFRNKFIRVTEDQPVAIPVNREVLLGQQSPALSDKDPIDDDVKPEKPEDTTPDAGSADDEEDLIDSDGRREPPKELSIKSVRGTKLFNVVDEDGKVVNPKPLSRAKAMKLAHPED